MLKKLLKGVNEGRKAQRKAELYRNLIRHEAKIGGEIFGPVQPGGRREFFCLDEHTWVWHEEWVATDGQRKTKTTRYDVRPNGIVKSQDGHYRSVDKQEAKRLVQAIRIYDQRVQNEMYANVHQARV